MMFLRAAGGETHAYRGDFLSALSIELLLIAAIVFVAAVTLATLFTYIRSRKTGIPMWGNTARRLLWNTMVPLLVGGNRGIEYASNGLLPAYCAPVPHILRAGITKRQ